MKSPYVGQIAPNEVVTAQLLVLNKEIRQKKTGEPYLALLLADRTGELEGKMWDNVSEVMDTFDRDDFVKVKGLVQVYQKRSQFTIHKLRRLSDEEVDFDDFFPCSDRNVDEMWRELQGTIEAISSPDLRALLNAIFADEQIATNFRLAPAAKNIHHACRGGLLQHVLSLCALAKVTAPHYPGVDGDLVIAGAILHDIGKIEELSYTRSFQYSAEGQLLGHIVIGLRIIAEKLQHLPHFPPKLRTLLEHLLISHHGELEFGSPKVPAFPEALLLHHLDNLDSKMEAMRSAIARDAQAEEEFTGWIPSLERSVLRKHRYFASQPALTFSPPPSTPPPSPLPEVTPAQPAPPTPQPSLTQPPPTQPSVTQAAPATQASSESAPPPEPHPAPASKPAPAPGSHPPPPPQKSHQKPPVNTLFGEKLQAVLSSDK